MISWMVTNQKGELATSLITPVRVLAIHFLIHFLFLRQLDT
jgi:hypothetical protein